MYDIMELSNKSLEELYAIAEDLNIKKVKSFSKDELVYRILDEQAIQGVNTPIQRKQRNRIISHKSEKVERPDKAEKGQMIDKPEKIEKIENIEKPHNPNEAQDSKEERPKRQRQRIQKNEAENLKESTEVEPQQTNTAETITAVSVDSPAE